jgi:hypothetical protein
MATIERPRFTVATCTGFAIGRQSSSGSVGISPGLSAHVLDRWNCHRVVRTYRSEDVNQRPPRTKGHDRTLALAAAECDRLNRKQRRSSGRERA